MRQQIRVQRMRLGLSQNELAEHLGVSRSTIKNWETGTVATCRLKNDYRLRQFLEGNLESNCHIHKQIPYLRDLLQKHTPPELQRPFLTALKKAACKAGGMEELLLALEGFLEKTSSLGKKSLRG